MKEELLAYVRDALAKGYREGDLRPLLRTQGWSDEDVEWAFAELHRQEASSRVAPPPEGGSMIPIEGLFRRAYKVYRRRMGALVGIQAVQMVISIFLMTGFVFAGILLGLRAVLTGGRGLAAVGIGVIFLALAFLAVTLLLMSWATAATIIAIRDGREGIGVIESCRRGWRVLPNVVPTMLLVGLIVFGGFLLLVVPAIIFSVWYSMAVAVAVVEGCTATQALARSKDLVHGYGWDVFVRRILLTTLLLALYFIPLIAFTLLIRAAPFPINLLLSTIQRLISTAAGLLLAPFNIVYGYMIYLDLRRIKG